DVVLFRVFFFQAEDGIRDATVTGVQTCALPISAPRDVLVVVADDRRLLDHASLCAGEEAADVAEASHCDTTVLPPTTTLVTSQRSEERRVGKEGRSRWSRGQ